MKDKIFQKLKQGYSHLGLGDDVLLLHAETLNSMGIVTDDNIESVVVAQKSLLEGLQKAADKRASDAATKARNELQKQHEEELKKKADDEAKAKAEKEAAEKAAKEEAERKAKEEAERKAAEEAERKKKEELEQNKEVPESVKKLIEQMRTESAEQKKAHEEQIRLMTESTKKMREEFEKQMKDMMEGNKALRTDYDALKKERDAQKAAEAKRQRADMILNKAKELNIPQSRIEEGFVIADDADESTINEYLSKVAKNITANALPERRAGFQLREDGHEVSKEEMDAIAKSMVR